jgi:hypothetical protein
MINWDNYHLGINLSGNRVLITYKPKKGPIEGVMEVRDSVDRTDEFLQILPKFFEHLEKTGRVLLYSEGKENKVILSLDTIIDKLEKIREASEDVLEALEDGDLDTAKDYIEDIQIAVEEILKLKKVDIHAGERNP